MTKNIFDNVFYIKYINFADFKFVYNLLAPHIKIGIRYSIISRVTYIDHKLDSTTDHKTLGIQIPFTHDYNLYDNTKKLHKVLNERLYICMEKYEFTDVDIDGITIIIFKVNYTDSVTPLIDFNVNTLKDSKDLINISKVSDAYKIIPLNFNINSFGIPLIKNIKDGLVESIFLVSGEIVDFKSRINSINTEKHRFEKFSSDINFFFNDKNNIIIVDSKSNINKISVYSIDGLFIYYIQDEILDETNFIRTYGNVKSYISTEKGIVKKELSVNFKPLSTPKIYNLQSKMINPD